MEPQPPPLAGNIPAEYSGGAFPRTRWTIVARLRETDEVAAKAALSQLCEAYWAPIYAFVRRSGYAPQDSEDWTQAFFEYLISHEKFAQAGPERGRLRSFLIGRLKGFLSTNLRTANRLKRGGGQQVFSLDAAEAKRQVAEQFADEASPDVAYDRAWLATVLARALEALQQECEAEGKGTLFAELQPFLTETPDESYAAVSARLQMSEGAARVAVHRLRGRYREALLRQVAETVSGPDDLGRELGELLGMAK